MKVKLLKVDSITIILEFFNKKKIMGTNQLVVINRA